MSIVDFNYTLIKLSVFDVQTINTINTLHLTHVKFGEPLTCTDSYYHLFLQSFVYQTGEKNPRKVWYTFQNRST